jgi:hypothetical protein
MEVTVAVVESCPEVVSTPQRQHRQQRPDQYRELINAFGTYQSTLKRIRRALNNEDLTEIQVATNQAVLDLAKVDFLKSWYGFSEQQVRAAEDAAKTLTRG